MPLEAFSEASLNNPLYGTATDVFSFGCIALHVFSEKWPVPTSQKVMVMINESIVIPTEVERRQKYLDKMWSGDSEAVVLKGLVEQCLNDDPNKRPTIQEVSSSIMPLKV